MKERNDFIIQLNDAFSECNIKFLADSVTEDIQWIIVGERIISGKIEFEKSLERMRLGGPLKITVSDVINTEEKSVVEGVVEFKVETGKKRKYAFCDVYIFAAGERRKIKELRTYVTQIKKA